MKNSHQLPGPCSPRVSQAPTLASIKKETKGVRKTEKMMIKSVIYAQAFLCLTRLTNSSLPSNTLSNFFLKKNGFNKKKGGGEIHWKRLDKILPSQNSSQQLKTTIALYTGTQLRKADRHTFPSLQSITFLTICVLALRYIAAKSIKQKKWLITCNVSEHSENSKNILCSFVQHCYANAGFIQMG